MAAVVVVVVVVVVVILVQQGEDSFTPASGAFRKLARHIIMHLLF